MTLWNAESEITFMMFRKTHVPQSERGKPYSCSVFASVVMTV